MAPTKKDPTILALEAVHAALKPLEAADRQRVLASVYALLEMGEAPESAQPTLASSRTPGPQVKSQPAAPARPVAIRELIQEKKPRTHPQFITLFAYYREKHQNLPTFSRAILEGYYATSRETPPKNYDRDFVEAVKRGWIHEDGENSYITSKGIEVVESNFADVGEKSLKPSKSKKKPARKTSR